MRYRFYHLIFILSFLSCSNDDSKNIEYNEALTVAVDHEIVDIPILDSLINIAGIIELNFPENVKYGSVDELFSTIHGFIVVDKITKSIFVFDEYGNFISRINKNGKGPDEYISMFNVSLDFLNKNELIISVLDTVKQTLFKYNIKGECVDVIKFNDRVEEFFSLESSYYVTYSGNDSGNINQCYLEGYDKNGIIIESFPFKENILLYNARSKNFIYNQKDSILYYHHFYDDRLYKIMNDSLSIEYVFDFGNYSFPGSKVLEMKSVDQYRKFIGQGNFIGKISNVLTNGKILYFNYSKGEDIFHFLFTMNDPQNKLNFDTVKRSKYGVSVTPMAADEKYFYNIINSWSVSDSSKKLLERDFQIQINDGIEKTKTLIVKYNYRINERI
jgi:hypothetical protein